MEGTAVKGIRIMDQGTDKDGNPSDGFMPGMDITADLTVVGDGPVGAIGRHLDQTLGFPEGHHQRDWALGMKMVVELPEGVNLEVGTVLHTFGYPEPEIFGFMYVLPDRMVSLGIFVPSWMDSPTRTAYRYLQYWMQHPAIWPYIEGGTVRSWGAKSLQESGKRGEPFLAGSGVDEAWTTGTQLADGVLELLKNGESFTEENLKRAYVDRRRESWVEKDARIAEKSRDGFSKGIIRGLVGMALAGFTNGKLFYPGQPKRPQDRIPSLEDYFRGQFTPGELEDFEAQSRNRAVPLVDILMEKMGWPRIEYDGKILFSHQDALLMGGKVQANPGYADHVTFVNPSLCSQCGAQVCIEMCSGQAIAKNPEGGTPQFDREKCVHCGACLWNCTQSDENNPERTNVAFTAGSGGFHSAEN